jgi:integrase
MSESQSTTNGDDQQKKQKKTRKARGRGEGSIFYDEAKKRWVCQISLPPDGTGKRKRPKVTGKTKLEVQDKLRKLQNKAEKGQLPAPGRLTVGQFLTTWLAAIKPTVAAHTYLAYERDVNNALKPKLGALKLEALTALHVQKLYTELGEDGVSAAMQKKAGVTLSAALSYAVQTAHLVPHNVAKDVKKPRHEPEEIRPLNHEQWGRFMAAARSDPLFALYVLWVDSCAREGELFALTWPAVDFEGGAVTITKSLEEVKGKLRLKDVKTKKSRRRIALSGFTMEVLAEHRKRMRAAGRYGPDKPVFCAPEGGWLRKSNVQRRSFQVIVDRANARLAAEAEEQGRPAELLPDLRPYDLRHTGATLLLLAGENIKVVSERLGHSTTNLTLNTYSHVLDGMQEQAAAKIDVLFRAGAEKAEQRQKAPSTEGRQAGGQ